jgi:hypothetical protein
MKKLSALLIIILCSGCSTTIVYSPKEIIHYSDNGSVIESTNENKGSDLSGSTAKQDSSGGLDAELPLP